MLRRPLRVPHFSVGVLGGIQPDKIPIVIDGPDDGFSSRLLWSWPEPVPGFTLCREPLDDTAATEALVRLSELKMATDAFGVHEPRFIPLTRTAEDAIE